MYPVSADYKNVIKKEVRDARITGTITLKDDTVITITDEDVVQGSLYITEQCVSGEDIEVGNVYAAEMGLSLSTPLDNPYTLDGARIILHFGLKLGDGLWETVPLGYYYVTDIARKAGNVDITALDGMMLFDVPIGNPGSSNARGFIVYACQVAGVMLGTSLAAIDALPNALTILSEPDASIKTARDLLMWACQITGSFARTDRQGQLEIVPIAARQTVKAIDKKERFSSDVSDFAVKITRVSMQIGETEYSRGTDGMTMVLEENPLMAGLSDAQINGALDSLLAQLTQVVYVPFKADYMGDPALQPGDFITIRDAGILDSEIETYFLADTMPFDIRTDVIVSMITHSTWRYRGKHNIKAAGKIGLIRGVQNQQIKAASSIAAMARSTRELAMAINQSTQLIKDAMGGHVLIRQADETNEILIMDHPDPALATKIWRWNMGGLGYSDNCTGADNPAREYDIAMTMDGAINANFIRTGMIAAEHLQIGAATTFEAGYDPSAKNSTYMQDADPVTAWTRSEYPSHVDDTWYSQAEQKTRIFKNSDAYFFNLGVGGGSVINGYAGSSFSTLGRPVPISYFGIKGATSGIGNLYLWKLDSSFRFVELVATGNKIYEDGGANCHCELMLEANTNYAIIASVAMGNITVVNGSSVISNDYVTGVLNRNFSGTSAPSAGTELAATMEHEIRLGIYGWVEVEDATANSKNTTFSACPSDGKYKKNDIMIPSVGFVSGAKTFNAGEIYQALADGDGIVFNSAHWTEASLISSWKKTGSTTIDGGQIAADTIEAVSLKSNTAMINFLNTLNLTAKYVSAEGILAGTITLTEALKIASSDGNLEITGTELKYAHTNGTESRLDAAGLRLYDDGLLLPYISTVDAGMIDKFNKTEGYWNYIVGNGYKKYFYLKRRGIRWLNQAGNVKMLVTQGEELEWYDPSQYRHTGIKGMKYAVGDITNIAADVTVRSNSVSSGSTASMILLDLDANNSDGYYAQEYITINGETRKIVQYDGGNQRAYVDNSFSSAPESGDAYLIHTGPGGVNVKVESWYLAPWYSGDSGGEYYYPLTFGYMLILNN